MSSEMEILTKNLKKNLEIENHNTDRNEECVLYAHQSAGHG